ncbi:phage tail protein [Enterobacter hormaechei]|uniref:phage tail fiber protein n=4 Tax=Enterobacter hormaechei TaxID=158836 RepID=UPI0010054919|nr:phage tail protein [Enterobacter hormaechei]MCC9331889.1 phage tail protein [Enterobacter hormaechei subsp. steigerwaltii]MCC9346502.1 phage tail protein [Enterobacter hormaechei subsp. steigerwaltii]MCC9362163.1 phage tail protein [Enterobacter hormaechei subsp. steigerwaltii]MCC9371894.1 phage tail protein [Enterobacter hormaechei subsp. steigerwaltii]MCC9431646.1 phage tail protein [Enterobacter hormaechei subsp. steigerwaltii]
MLYNTGTIAINGNTATGTGTNWTAPASQIRVGQTLFVLSNPVQMFQITAINSATSLTITPAASPALSGQKYGILVTDSLSVDGLAQSMSQLINEYDENIGAWETFATTSANQSITVTINGARVTIPAIGKLVQKGSNGAAGVSGGGTGATNAADARTNLGLGNSATRNVDEQFSPGSAYLNGAAVMAQCHRDYRSLASYDAIAQYPLGMSFGIQSGGNAWGGGSGVDTYTGMLTLRGWHDFSGGGYVSWQLASTSQGLKYRQGNGKIQGNANVGFSTTHTLYSTQNTTKASDGTLKAASPVIKVFSDGAYQTNDESEGCTVTRMKTGEYLIEGCMGMNSDAEWGGIDGGFDIPKDRNGQALIWLDYEVNADGSVLVKTFHREYPTAPAFARNSREGYADGDPADIPADQFVSVRVEMPQNSIWNQRAAMAQVPDSSSD